REQSFTLTIAHGLVFPRWSGQGFVRLPWIQGAPDRVPTDPNIAQQVGGYTANGMAIGLRGMFYPIAGSRVRVGLGGAIGAHIITLTLTDTPLVDPRSYDYRPSTATSAVFLVEPRVSLEVNILSWLRMTAWGTATFLPIPSVGCGLGVAAWTP